MVERFLRDGCRDFVVELEDSVNASRGLCGKVLVIRAKKGVLLALQGAGRGPWRSVSKSV